MDVAIIGTGNMARGIGTRVVAGGNSVILYVRAPEKAHALVTELRGKLQEGATVDVKTAGEDLQGEFVVPAIPYSEIASFIERYGDQLSDKIYVDITNPIDYKTLELLPPANSSGAEEIAKLLPEGAKIVKAFNTTFAAVLAAGEVDGKQPDVFIAGDDEETKNRVKQLAEEGGLRGLDAGPLQRARILEEMQLMHILLQEPLGTNFKSSIKILP